MGAASANSRAHQLPTLNFAETGMIAPSGCWKIQEFLPNAQLASSVSELMDTNSTSGQRCSWLGTSLSRSSQSSAYSLRASMNSSTASSKPAPSAAIGVPGKNTDQPPASATASGLPSCQESARSPWRRSRSTSATLLPWRSIPIGLPASAASSTSRSLRRVSVKVRSCITKPYPAIDVRQVRNVRDYVSRDKPDGPNTAEWRSSLLSCTDQRASRAAPGGF